MKTWEITLSINDGEYLVDVTIVAKCVERGPYPETVVADGVGIHFGAPVVTLESY